MALLRNPNVDVDVDADVVLFVVELDVEFDDTLDDDMDADVYVEVDDDLVLLVGLRGRLILCRSLIRVLALPLLLLLVAVLLGAPFESMSRLDSYREEECEYLLADSAPPPPPTFLSLFSPPLLLLPLRVVGVRVLDLLWRCDDADVSLLILVGERLNGEDRLGWLDEGGGARGLIAWGCRKLLLFLLLLLL